MNFDLRTPLGLLFLGVGLILAGYGAAAPGHARSLGVNVDLGWGAALAVFGAAMLGAAYARRRRLRGTAA